jgi:hypothetical protein
MRRFVALASVATLAAVAAMPAQAATPTFGQPVQLSPGVAFGIGVSNLNGDAAPDALITPGAIAGGVLQSILGKGDGTFFGPADVTGAGQVERMAFGDLDGDGDTDVALNSTGGVFVLTGNGAGGFTSGLVGPATFSTDVAIGDVTGDGRLDILATLFNNNATATDLLVLRQNPNGTFTAVPQTFAGNAGTGPRSLALADLNGDGMLDVVTGDSLGIAYVLPGNNTGNFATRDPFNVMNEANDILLVDLDNDGKRDLVAASNLGGTVAIRKGNGSVGPTAFGPLATIPVGSNANWVAAGDLDGDGFLDLAVGNQNAADPGRISILRGKGDTTFDPATQLVVGGTNQSPGVAIADANLDDRPDIWVTPRDAAPSVYLNTTLFPPATVTTGPASNVSTDFATLSGTMDNDNRRGFWHFEYGETTAYGTSTTEQALGPNPDPQFPAANVGGLKPGTTYHYRLVGRTLAGGTVNGADATFTTAPTASTAITVQRATFNVKYTLGVAKGEVVVRGNATADSKVTLRLLRVNGAKLVSIRNYDVGTIKAGAFTKRLKVPRTVLPGKFAVRAVGTSGPVPLVPSEVRSTLAAPPEGIVRRSFASSVPNGPPALRLPGKRTQVNANFVFAVQPKGKRGIIARWFLPSGRALAGVPKPNAKRIGSVISVRRGSLQPGRYRCELRVKGKLVAVVRVRVG